MSEQLHIKQRERERGECVCVCVCVCVCLKQFKPFLKSIVTTNGYYFVTGESKAGKNASVPHGAYFHGAYIFMQ